MNSISQQFENWEATDNQLCIKTLDCHTGGEPLRIITSGFPELKGQTVLEKRRFCKEHFDHLRTALMFEPRGHADMYGAIVVNAERDNSHFGAIFIHNEGYSSMCGHAVIALTKFAIESGLVVKTGDQTKVIIDVPCGQIHAIGHGNNETIESVTFDCVPSYVLYQEQTVDVDGIGKVSFDVAFGGAYYAYVMASEVGLLCTPDYYNKMIDIGRKIKQAVSDNFEIVHPFEADLSFLYGTIFIDDASHSSIHSRNVCVFADGEVDRSPTGSGICGRIAIHMAKKQVELNQSITIESILGSQFQVKAIRQLDYAGHSAVIPQVTGRAYISGKSELIIDPEDPFKSGFILR